MMILDKVKSYWKAVTVLFFAVVLVSGMLLAGDYGMPWDETTEFGIFASNIKEYARVLEGEDSSFVRWADEQGYPYISEYIEKDHGQSAYYPCTPFFIRYAYEGNMRELSHVWHRYTFFVTFLGLLSLYGMIHMLTGSEFWGMAGVLMYWLSPRIFADGFYNNKDMVFASLVLIVLYFGIRFVEKREPGCAVLLGIAAGFASNTRVIGFWALGLVGLLYLLVLTVHREWNRRNFLLGVSILISFGVTFYLITPACWPSLAGYFEYVISQSMDFVRWEGSLLYQGEMFGNSFRTLPWHYVPVLIFLTSPLVFLMLMVAGHLLTAKRLLRIKEILEGQEKYYLLILVFVWPILIYTMLCDPVIYNGWRHLYFVYGPFVVFGIRALKLLAESGNRALRRISLGAYAGQVLYLIVILALSHPNQFGFYNILAGGNVEKRYELDYWDTAAAGCIRHLIDQEKPTEPIVISAYDGYSYAGLPWGKMVLPEKYQDLLVILPEDTYLEADYMFVNTTYREITEKRYEMRLGGYEPFDYDAWGNEVYSENCLGNRLWVVYKRK